LALIRPSASRATGGGSNGQDKCLLPREQVSYFDIAEITLIVGGPELDHPPEAAAAVADMDDPWK